MEQETINADEINARIMMLASQRNNAMDQIAFLNGKITILQLENATLKNKIAEFEIENTNDQA